MGNISRKLHRALRGLATPMEPPVGGKAKGIRIDMASGKLAVRLTQAQRLAVAELQPQLADRLQLEVKNERSFALSSDEAAILKEAAYAASSGAPTGMKRNTLRHIEHKLRDALGQLAAAGRAYQFKITLKDAKPPIWRRIQVNDCTLDKLHEHIQSAMGWTNSHLNQFKIGGRFYGDPVLFEETFEELDFQDSTTTRISDVLPSSGKQFSFSYEYDLGDSWEHQVLFEGWMDAQSGSKYPICLEGALACPLEDVGGVWGYQEFLAAIADPKHKRHAEFLSWCGGSFAPGEFDPRVATTRMLKGLQDWRKMM